MNDVIIHFNSTTEEKLRKLEPKLPTDIHLVRYRKPTWKKKQKASAIRAFRMVDIFDYLHAEGWEVLEIRQGFGRIKPQSFTPK